LTKTSDPESGTAVDSGSTIVYTLTATNTGDVEVTGATAVDTLPADVTLVMPLDPSLGAPGTTLTWTIPTIPVGGSVAVSFSVTVDTSAEGKTLDNVVVPGPGGECLLPGDCVTHHPVKQIIAFAETACELDAAYLAYDFSTLNLPNAGSLPLTITWRSQDGTVVRVDTIPAGQTSGRILWPGMVLNSDGVAVGWPGWREAVQGEVPEYANMVSDPTLPTYVFRLPMTLTFSINPETTVATQYPGVTPAGCAVPRTPELQILKTVSTETVQGGSQFTYAINVSNTSALGTAYPVTLTDPISPDIAVTAITTSVTASPKWNDCAVTGADSNGYGGVLNCNLSGFLVPGAAAPEIVLNATVLPGTTVSEIPNTAEVCWQNPSETGSPRACATSTVVVHIPPSTVVPPPSSVPPVPPVPGASPVLPNTGVDAAGMGWVALMLLISGGALVFFGRRRSGITRRLH
jgi:uncharacterized repeat protein (TIGR01451 family)/LPXTG-motif cell wall-anchored protein